LIEGILSSYGSRQPKTVGRTEISCAVAFF
jgi:hypothetical protein